MPIVGCVVFVKPDKGKEIEDKLKNKKNVYMMTDNDKKLELLFFLS